METLATGRNSPGPIVVDATNVYWGNWDSVATVAIHGGTPRTIAADQKRPIGIDVFGGDVYWTNPAVATLDGLEKTATVVMQKRDDRKVIVLASGSKNPGGLAVDGTNAYWTEDSPDDEGDGSVMRAPAGGGRSVRLATGRYMGSAIAVAGGSVFWANGGRLKRVSTNGGGVTVLSPANLDVIGAYVAVDATSVYCFADPVSNEPPPIQSLGRPPVTMLLKISLDGSGTTVLVSALFSVDGLAVDDTSVYWGGTGIMKVPVGGGEPEMILAERQVSGIAVDATSVYWTSFTGGTVKRLTPK